AGAGEHQSRRRYAYPGHDRWSGGARGGGRMTAIARLILRPSNRAGTYEAYLDGGLVGVSHQPALDGARVRSVDADDDASRGERPRQLLGRAYRRVREVDDRG